MLLFCFCQMQSQAFAKPSHRDFSQKDVSVLNKIGTTHDLAKQILKIKNGPQALKKTSQQILEQAAVPLPQFQLKSKSLKFNFQNTDYELIHVRDSQYYLNQKMIDMNSDKWKSQFGLLEQSPVESLLINKSHAVAPLAYFVIWGVVVILASGCIAMSLGDANGGSTLQAKWIHVDQLNFNQAIRSIRQAYRAAGCGANADEAFAEEIDYAGFFRQYCKKSSDKIKSQKLAEQSQTTWYFGRELTYDEKVDSYIDDNSSDLGIGSLQTENLPAVRSCKSSANCRSMNYSELPAVDQEIMTQFIENEDFMRECVKQSLNETTAPQENKSGTTGTEQ